MKKAFVCASLCFAFWGCDSLDVAANAARVEPDGLAKFQESDEADLQKLLKKLDSRKYAVRQAASEELTELCKKDKDARDLVLSLKLNDLPFEVRYRVRIALQKSQTPMSFADAEARYYEHISKIESVVGLREQQERVSKLISDATIEALEKIEERLIAVEQPAAPREFDEIHIPGQPGRGLAGRLSHQRQSRLQRIEELHDDRRDILLATFASLGQVSAVGTSGIHFETEKSAYIVVHKDSDIFTIHEVGPGFNPREIEVKMEDILPSNCSLPPLEFPESLPVFVAKTQLRWSGSGVIMDLTPQGYTRIANNPVSTYFATIFPDWEEKICAGAKPARELGRLSASN